MTIRLFCSECGWHPEFRRKRTARRAAARHHCTTAPLAEPHPHWWLRLWTNLWTNRQSDAPHTDIDAVPDGVSNAAPPVSEDPPGYGEVLDVHGNRVRWAVLAAHYAETTRRARREMVELVRAGYQIGVPPYGYRALRLRVTDATGHSRLRAVLVPHWQTAAVVRQIFCWRADLSLGWTAIAARLNADLPQYPPPVSSGRWTAGAVRRIVTNPKYVGRQVWGRTIAGRPVPIEQWVTSGPHAHEPLVDPRTFQRAQMRVADGPHDATGPHDGAPPSAA